MQRRINVGDTMVVSEKTRKIVNNHITLYPGAVLKITGLSGRSKFEATIINRDDKNVVIDPRAPRYIQLIVTVSKVNLSSYDEYLREKGRAFKAANPQKPDQKGCHRPPLLRQRFNRPCFV